MIGLILVNHRIDKVGRNISTYFNPLNNKPTNVRMLIRYLNSINLTRTDLILQLNNMKDSDLPECRFCKINKVSLDLSDISNPSLTDRCSNTKCIKSSGASKGVKLRYKNGNGPGQMVSDESRRLRATNAQITRKINCTQGYQHLSPELRSDIIRKVVKTGHANGNMWYQDHDKLHSARVLTNKTALLNGTHNSQSGKNNLNKCIKFNYNGIDHSFKSNIEYIIFIRFKRLLSKYYNREKVVSIYDDKLYVADYIIKSKITNLPDVIEVKNGNLLNYMGVDVSSTNYSKFKSVILKNLSLLIIDGNTFHRINTLNDLNILFNK